MNSRRKFHAKYDSRADVTRGAHHDTTTPHRGRRSCPVGCRLWWLDTDSRDDEPDETGDHVRDTRSYSVSTHSAPAATVSLRQRSLRVSVPATPKVVRSTSRSRPTEQHETTTLTTHHRNRLIGPGLNVGVSIYSDCTGRAELTRRTVAIDICMTWAPQGILRALQGCRPHGVTVCRQARCTEEREITAGALTPRTRQETIPPMQSLAST